MTHKESILSMLAIIFALISVTVTANNCHGVHSIADEKGNEIVFPRERFLGKGAYGNVYEGHVVNGVFAGMELPERVAVKLSELQGTPKAMSGDIVPDDGFENEMNVLRLTRNIPAHDWSPNLMRIYAGAVLQSSHHILLVSGGLTRKDWSRSAKCGITVMELVRGKNLNRLLFGKLEIDNIESMEKSDGVGRTEFGTLMCCDEKKDAPNPEALDLVIQLIRGVDFMRKLRITHVDLKPDNIMIEEVEVGGVTMRRLVIADMGLATTPVEAKGACAHEGNMYYNVAQACSGFSPAFDAKAARLIVLEMLSGVPAYLNPTRNLGQYTAWLQKPGNLQNRAGVVFVKLDMRKRDKGNALAQGHRLIGNGNNAVEAGREVAIRTLRWHDASSTDLRTRLDPWQQSKAGEETLTRLSWLGNGRVAEILSNLEDIGNLEDACRDLCALIEDGNSFACRDGYSSSLARDVHVGRIRGGKKGVHREKGGGTILPSIDHGHFESPGPPDTRSSGHRGIRHQVHQARADLAWPTHHHTSIRPPDPRSGHHGIRDVIHQARAEVNYLPTRPSGPRSGHHGIRDVIHQARAEANYFPTRPSDERLSRPSGIRNVIEQARAEASHEYPKCYAQNVEKQRRLMCKFTPRHNPIGGGVVGTYPCTLKVSCDGIKEERTLVIKHGADVVDFGNDCAPCHAIN